MAQNRRRRRAQSTAKRRAYDQTLDAQHPRGRSTSRTRQRSGYQEQVIEFGTAAQSIQTDNSIEFPSQQARRRQQPSQSAARRRGSQHPQQQRQSPGSPQRRQGAAAARQNMPHNGRLRPTAANMRDPARREKRKKRRLTRAEVRRRRVMRRLTAFLTLLCVIAAGVYLTVTMLFKINSIQVQTEDGAVVAEAGGYSSEQILQALGVQLDDNIFSFDPAEKAESLEKVFPLLEKIRVERRYPTSVVVRVTEAAPAWAMQTESGWITLSSTLKILSQTAEQPALPTLYGGEPVSTEPGDQLDFAAPEAAASSAASEADSEAASASSSEKSASSETEQPEENRLSSLNTLLTALESRGMLADITRIEFADTEQMAFVYQSRISVLLGTLNELDYKMDFAQYLLQNSDGKGCAATDTGELDCSHVRSDGTLRPIFAQGDPILPSGYDITTQPVAAPAEETPSEEAPAEETPPEQTEQPQTEEIPAPDTPEAEQATDPTAAPAEGAAQ